jgi:hypothetical protein
MPPHLIILDKVVLLGVIFKKLEAQVSLYRSPDINKSS